MFIQHGDARIDGQGKTFYARGVKAGKEAYTAHPNWDDAELGKQAADASLLYLMSAPQGADRLMSGFIKGYRQAQKKAVEQAQKF
jgi:hypothetical protein